MQTFFFDMKDGVPLRDDQDLEISVVNALGREIHREFVHRDPADDASKE